MPRIKSILNHIIFAASLSLSAVCAHADGKLHTSGNYGFNRIVAFGDSLSDIGNVFIATNVLHLFDKNVPIIPAAPYWQGRFSNGSNWLENVSHDMDLPMQDYAWGGAKIDDDSLQTIPLNLLAQLKVENILTHHTPVTSQEIQRDQHTLWIFWIGANDYFGGTPTGMSEQDYVNQTIGDFKHKLDMALVTNNMRYILLLNLPDLGKTPFGREQPDQGASLTRLSTLHNQALQALVNDEQRQHSDLQLALFDTDTFMQDIIVNPNQYGLSIVDKPCIDSDPVPEKLTSEPFAMMNTLPGIRLVGLQGEFKANFAQNIQLRSAYHLNQTMINTAGPVVCSLPDQYLFWDDVHPTTAVHRQIARQVEEFIALNFEGK